MLPNARTSVLPHILTIAEDFVKPLMDKSDENYDNQLFAISTGFCWTIKQFMPLDRFIEYSQSEGMKTAHKVLADMLGRDIVTREDVDIAFDKERSKRPTPGIG